MKTIKSIIILFLMIVALASCSKNDYINVIPKDATMVTSINFANIAQKGELAESSYLNMAKGYMGMVLDDKAQKQVMTYMNEPSKMGIDFTVPAYIFITPSRCLGITMKVDSDSKLADFMALLQEQNLCSKPVKRDGMTTGTLLEDIDYAYDDDKFLMLMSMNDNGSAIRKQIMAKLTSQEKDDSFISTETFDRLESGNNKDIIMYSNLAVLPNDVAVQFKSFIPAGVKLADVEMMSSIVFTDGRATFTSEMFGASDKAQNAFEEANKHFRKIEGRYIDSPSDNFFVWGCAGVEGKWLLSTLKQDEKMKQMLYLVERGIDIEQIIGSIDGDLAVVLPSSSVVTGSSDQDIIDFIATAKVKDTNFLNDVDYWKKTMKEYNITMRESGKNQFLLEGGDMSINWGVDGSDVYIASTDAFKQNLTSLRSNLLKEYEDEIKNNIYFIYMNLQSLPLHELAQVTNIPAFAPKMSALKSIIIKSSSANKIEISVNLTDTKTNFLKQML